MEWKLLEGNCVDLMQTIPDDSVDCVVTDPPYGIKMEDWVYFWIFFLLTLLIAWLISM